MIFARKMSEYYIIIAGNIFSRILGGHMPPSAPSPTPTLVSALDDLFCAISAWAAMGIFTAPRCALRGISHRKSVRLSVTRSDDRIPKQVFCGQLAVGTCPQCGPVRRYKDSLKETMKKCGM